MGLFATPWTAAHQAPLSMGFSRQEYWSGPPLPSSGDPPHPEVEPSALALAGRFFTTEPPGKPRVSLPGHKQQDGEAGLITTFKAVMRVRTVSHLQQRSRDWITHLISIGDKVADDKTTVCFVA